MNDENEKLREKTILYFRDLTLVRVDIEREIVLLERDADDEQAITGYFALIICEIEELLNEGYILYRKDTVLMKDFTP